nr:FGGY-family carbohydrate kinase [Actinomadura madurae]
MLGNPVHYRDGRTAGVMERIRAELGDDLLYQASGLQFLPFNTIYQLAADDLAAASTLLLIPDLLAYWLTGEIGAERTNASTTGLLDVRDGTWSRELLARLDLPAAILPPLRDPGSVIGALRPDVAAETGHSALPVTAVGSHDTASAVVAVPATTERFAYISCGTWSLVGVELDAPVLTEASRKANFTNEGGVDGTVRYLRNVMGLWLLQESLRTWGGPDLPALLAEAADVPGLRSLVDPDDPEFLPPGDMPARIAAHCRRRGFPEPSTRAETVRCILDSLALAHRAALRQASRLSGRDVDVVHLVGGGSRNDLLCPADRRRRRPAGGGGPGGGDRARQRPDPGPRPRRGRRPGRVPRPGGRHPGRPPLHAVRGRGALEGSRRPPGAGGLTRASGRPGMSRCRDGLPSQG